jgi:hypothetical protein
MHNRAQPFRPQYDLQKAFFGSRGIDHRYASILRKTIDFSCVVQLLARKVMPPLKQGKSLTHRQQNCFLYLVWTETKAGHGRMLLLLQVSAAFLSRRALRSKTPLRLDITKCKGAERMLHKSIGLFFSFSSINKLLFFRQVSIRSALELPRHS